MNSFVFRNNDEIGKLEAETDSYLDNCFYETNVFRGLVNFDSSEENPDFTRRIIVGRTGSGKSALLRKITNDDHIKVHDKIEAENTIFEHINNNVFISSLLSSGIDLRGFYKALWIHVLLVKVISSIHNSTYESFYEKMMGFISGGKKKPYNPEMAAEYLEQYKDVFFNDKAIVEISDKLQMGVSARLGSAASRIGGKIDKEEYQKIQTETASYVSVELLRKQKEIIKILKQEFTNSKQVRIVISIDDLDKSWLSSSSIRYDFINALLDAFKELLDIKSVKILISIRTDILMGIYQKSMRQGEKDRSLIYPISWNKTEIREVIDARINYLVRHKYRGTKNVSMKDVFNFNVDGIPADDYILNKTMLRPRDAINFVNYCLSECDGKVNINEDIVISAEEKYYFSRKSALVTEWISIYKYIEFYLDAASFLDGFKFNRSGISQGTKDKISNYLLETVDKEDELHAKVVESFDEIMKIWFVVGVIGIQKTESLIIYSSFDKPSLDITDMDRNFYVHPLFQR